MRVDLLERPKRKVPAGVDPETAAVTVAAAAALQRASSADLGLDRAPSEEAPPPEASAAAAGEAKASPEPPAGDEPQPPPTPPEGGEGVSGLG
jgi:hypothetical protein